MRTETPIRVGIDGRVLMHYEMRGFARYTVELFRAMKEVAGDSVDLYSFSSGPIAPEFIGQLKITPIVFPARREMLWEQLELPKRLRQHGIDIFHATANRGLPYRRACKSVVTCHDVIDRLPEYCGREGRRGRWRKAYSDFVSRHSAHAYITVSNFSKQDICRLHGLPPDRVTVIYNAAHPRFYETLPEGKIVQVLNKYSLPRNYILFLGGFDIRKNAATLVDAFAKLPQEAPPLILAGEHKWGFAAIAKKITALGLAQRIACPGAIDDEDLPALYQSAIALINPSLYEGFGLQLVEAMASGIPVLASATTSLPEILDGSGLLFDPKVPNSITHQMERIYRDPVLGSALAAKSRLRARFFSWHKAAEQTLDLYFQLLGRTKHLPTPDHLAAPESRP
jgi:glycosyltransferase involved in cell wall biosynthesis